MIRIGFLPSYRNRWTDWTAKMRDDSIAALSALPGVEVVYPKPSGSDGSCADCGLSPQGAVHTLDEAEAIAAYFAQEKVDALVICALDFGDERSCGKIAEKLGVPTMLYATKEPPALNHASLSRMSDSYCGNLGIALALNRRDIPFHFAGIFFPDEADFAAEAETFVRAVAVVKGLIGVRIGQVGVRPPSFETVAYSEVAMIEQFGENVIYANISDITSAAKAYADDDPQVQAVVQDIRDTVPTITVADDYLIKAAKVELALVDFWNRSGLSGLAVQCWPSMGREMGISVCALYGRMTQRGMLTACETDVLGALIMIATHEVARHESLPHFIDWTIQHRENPNWLMAWHCGNAPVSLAADPSQVALRARRDMVGEGPVEPGDPTAGLYQFQIKPGKVTLCRLTELKGEWKMLIAAGEVIPSDETLAGTWSWVEVEDHAKLYRTLVEEGFIHHASMIHGDHTAALVQACKFLGITPIVV
jgi:L-fucose isomerase-like protein